MSGFEGNPDMPFDGLMSAIDPEPTLHIETALACVSQSRVAHLGEHSFQFAAVRTIKLVVLRVKKVSELASCLIVRELCYFTD